jgi:hypothetical protein
MDGTRGVLYLGGGVDPATGERTGERLVQPAHHLTTHGVIVGMTGSGKTGLGVILLEEALLAGIPVLVLDPKGDMGNLMLTFPGFRPDDFRPWIDPAEARRKGMDVDALAASTAATWREGLASWDIGPERVRRLRDAADVTLYTPGSSSGVPLDLLGSLRAPPSGADPESVREEIEGFVSSLLTLADVDADPLSGPEHILLCNVIEDAWGRGRDLELADLIRLVQDPPFRKLGVFSLDEFVPRDARRALALRLNALLASPSFAAWLQGRPLDMDALVRGPDGRPGASILYLAHLSDVERQFVVTLLLTRLVTWMRSQPGTSDLRLLVYMDEMFGFAPPTARPPSKKPILTLFKQARAHGVGMVVATQNPVDLDYKIISNAGTWMLGRLQTERDKARVLEGLRSASGAVDVVAVDTLLSSLGKRQFVRRTTRSAEPDVFTTRWAMSYLRGGLTRDEVARLMAEKGGAAGEAAEEAAPGPSGREGTGGAGAAKEGEGAGGGEPYAAAPAVEPIRPEAPLADDESPLPPDVPSSVPVHVLDPAAPWADRVGASSPGRRLEPALVARMSLTFDDRWAELDHTEEWEIVFAPLEERLDPAAALTVDYDDRDFRPEAPEDARYVLSDAPLTDASFWRDAERTLKEHAHRHRAMTLWRNRELKLYSRPGEERKAFAERCRRTASDGADEDAAALRERYEKRADRLRDALEDAERRVRELEVDLSARRQQELVAGAGQVLSMFLRGRARASGLSGAASRRSMTRRAEERLHTARERERDREEELRELEEELLEDLRRIVAAWAEKADAVEEMEVGLEKGDIHVDEVALLWIPRGASP